jgi:hypothetical protein
LKRSEEAVPGFPISSVAFSPSPFSPEFCGDFITPTLRRNSNPLEAKNQRLF